jgi:hypothetical protein
MEGRRAGNLVHHQIQLVSLNTRARTLCSARGSMNPGSKMATKLNAEED